jgi:hypothetical protein
LKNYQEGDVVEIYKDYQEGKGLLGKGRLVRYISKGLAFILEDYTNCPVYNTERWEVEWIEKTDPTFPYLRNEYDIMYIEGEQKIETTIEKDEDIILEDEIVNSQPDRFISFDGQEAF